MPARVLAALATVPGREAALAECLASLRPQVDLLKVVCHDTTEPPPVVRDLADEWLCEPDSRGSAAKLHWARSHTGLYLGCDDDLRYPPDYVAVMDRWVKRWKGRALVTCHGRILAKRSRSFTDVLAAHAPRQRTPGRWLNYPGGCAMAFDTRLNVPDRVPGKNLEEAWLAVWAHEHFIPIWLVPHGPDFLAYLLNGKNLPTIWDAERGAGFANRNAVIEAGLTLAPWGVNRCR